MTPQDIENILYLGKTDPQTATGYAIGQLIHNYIQRGQNNKGGAAADRAAQAIQQQIQQMPYQQAQPQQQYIIGQQQRDSLQPAQNPFTIGAQQAQSPSLFSVWQQQQAQQVPLQQSTQQTQQMPDHTAVNNIINGSTIEAANMANRANQQQQIAQQTADNQNAQAEAQAQQTNAQAMKLAEEEQKKNAAVANAATAIVTGGVGTGGNGNALGTLSALFGGNGNLGNSSIGQYIARYAAQQQQPKQSFFGDARTQNTGVTNQNSILGFVGRTLAQNIIKAKNIYALANVGYQTAQANNDQKAMQDYRTTMQRAASAAQQARIAGANAGIDLSMYGSGDTLQQAETALNTNDVRAANSVLNMPTTGEYYSKMYNAAKSAGVSDDVAAKVAQVRANAYQQGYVKKLENTLGTYGIKDNAITPLGMQILVRLGQENKDAANIYGQSYALPAMQYRNDQIINQQNNARNNAEQISKLEAVLKDINNQNVFQRNLIRDRQNAQYKMIEDNNIYRDKMIENNNSHNNRLKEIQYRSVLGDSRQSEPNNSSKHATMLREKAAHLVSLVQNADRSDTDAWGKAIDNLGTFIDTYGSELSPATVDVLRSEQLYYAGLRERHAGYNDYQNYWNSIPPNLRGHFNFNAQ